MSVEFLDSTQNVMFVWMQATMPVTACNRHKGGWTLSVYMLDACLYAKESTWDHEGASERLRLGNLL